MWPRHCGMPVCGPTRCSFGLPTTVNTCTTCISPTASLAATHTDHTDHIDVFTSTASTASTGAAIEQNTGAKSSFPLRGGYTTNWEGGVRAAALVNGGLLPAAVRGKKLAGATSYVHLCDFYATFCYLAGVNAADTAAERLGLPAVDSLNMVRRIPRLCWSDPRLLPRSERLKQPGMHSRALHDD